MLEGATPEDLKAVERLIAGLTPEKVKELASIPAVAAQMDRPFRPLPGPQTMAYLSTADQLLYGGQAGGGKSYLLLGVAANDHKRSLILRRESVEIDGLVDDSRGLLTEVGKFNGQDSEWTLEGHRSIKFGGMKDPTDWRKYAGRARDFIGLDEGGEFLEEQISSLLAWLRSAEGLRCRLIIASNPPRAAEGQWLVEWFAPWLDETHPRFPAGPGELVWCIMHRGKTQWVDGPGRTVIDGEDYTHISRTFVPASVEDNPYLAETDYKQRLQNLPPGLREQLLYGVFALSAKDHEWQVVPTDWIRQAQERWSPEGFRELKMTAMGVDVAQGGEDETVLAPRYGSWFAPLVEKEGAATPDAPTVAGLVTTHRRDNAVVVVDIGGGYGGGVVSYLTDNGFTVAGFDARRKSTARTADNQLGFVNKRAEAYWKLREALDPGQDGGSVVQLPPGKALLADLSAARWKMTNRGIQIELKDEIKKRLGRSPDRADAVVMCWSEGQSLAERKARRGGRQPKVVLAYEKTKRRPRRRAWG
jgi:hypothetical protein